MAQNSAGALKVAAKKIGVPIEEYVTRMANGQKWCTNCRQWHDVSHFGVDNSRHDKLTTSCSKSRNSKAMERYEPKLSVSKRGVRYAIARDGDKRQARARVNHLVYLGLLANPNSVPCTDCGHLGNDKRHEYDHYKGYAAIHHETVEVVCSTCHAARHPIGRGRVGKKAAGRLLDGREWNELPRTWAAQEAT